MSTPRIQVLLDDVDLAPEVLDALDLVGAAVDLRRLDEDEPQQADYAADARLVVTFDSDLMVTGKSQELRRWLGVGACATLVYSDIANQREAPETLGEPTCTVGFASNLSRDALAGQLTAMCRHRSAMNAMQRELTTLRATERAMRNTMRRLDDELRLAGSLQRDLLPATLPEVHGLDIHTFYRPAEVISGDSYDVVRVSDSKVAMTLADATGHGVAAGLLCASFIRTLCRPQRNPGDPRGTNPDEVLTRLNRELCAADLSDCLFVTAIHATYDEDTGVVRWARAGAPYPILVRQGAEPRLITSEGPMAGLTANARFEVMTTKLHPGDVLLFYTDGLEGVGSTNGRAPSSKDLVASKWFNLLPCRSIRRSLIELDAKMASSVPQSKPADDTTVLALERTNSRGRATPAESGVGLATRRITAAVSSREV